MNAKICKAVVAVAAVALVLASATISGAAIPKKKWQSMDDQFKLGYIAGFLDCAQMARNENPWGAVDRTFPWWPEVKPMHWLGAVNRAFQRKNTDGWTINDAMAAAGTELRKRFGEPPSPMERVSERLKKSLSKGKPDAPEAAKKPAQAAAAKKAVELAKQAAARKAARDAMSPAERKAERLAERLAERREAAERKAKAAKKAAKKAEDAEKLAAAAAAAVAKEKAGSAD